MSFCTLHRKVQSNAVALCGLYPGPLDTYLRENPHLRRIVLCLDADPPGRQAAKQLEEKYSQKGCAVTVMTPAHGKDWNETLRHQQRERGR
jgi:DNA primase